MIEDLREHLIDPTDKNQQMLDELEGKEKENDWCAGEQVKALRYYLDDEVKMVAHWIEDSYQGNCMAILFVDGTYFLWRDSFGSCSGCDALEDCDEKKGFEYIINTLTSVKEFGSIKEVWKYLEKDYKDYLYYDEALEELKKSFESGELLQL